MKNHIIRTVIILILISFAQTSRAELGIGLGYPYLGLKYNLDAFPAIGVEAKYSFGEGVNVFAGRGYWNFWSLNPVGFYAGYELGSVRFATEGIDGSGREHGPFLGMEVTVLDNCGLALDISQVMLDLNSQNVGLAGSETVLNIAFYWYFL